MHPARLAIAASSAALVLCACDMSTSAEDDPANHGNIVFSLSGDSLETSTPGEYTSGGGDPRETLLVVAHGGTGTALRAAQSGTGSAAQLVAANATDEAPALRVESAGDGPAARFTGGRVVIGEHGALVFASIASVTAADRIAPEAITSVIHVEHADGTQANQLALPSAVPGQIALVVNDDDDPVVLGDARVAPGTAAQLVYVGGRFRVLGAAPAVPAAAGAETAPDAPAL